MKAKTNNNIKTLNNDNYLSETLDEKSLKEKTTIWTKVKKYSKILLPQILQILSFLLNLMIRIFIKDYVREFIDIILQIIIRTFS